MNHFRKFTFGYILGKDGICYGFNVKHKKQISIRKSFRVIYWAKI